MMRRLTKVACGAAALALVLGVTTETRAGKPDKPGGKPGNDQPKTQACILTEDGDATGGGEVGVDAKSYGPLTMTVEAGTPLGQVFAVLGTTDPYSGVGSVFKKQGRLDFYFGIEEPECRPAEWGEEPGPGTGICRYRLILLNGVYVRKADRVEFTAAGAATAILNDNWLVPGDPEISSGTANLVVQFRD
jgi:hypothetical protein